MQIDKQKTEEFKETSIFEIKGFLELFFCQRKFIGQRILDGIYSLPWRRSLSFKKQTQAQAGGITDMYLKYGTYCKAFTTVMMMPSAVKASMMRTSNSRIHHSINWGRTAPVIIREDNKK